jgi:hypothetical protein
MRKYLILSLIGITLLSGCKNYNDSFHKEFYDKTNKSYQTFEGEYNIRPGVSHGDISYVGILDSYFSNTQDIGKLKTLTYKKRSGYTGIYFKTYDSDKKDELAYSFTYALTSDYYTLSEKSVAIYGFVAAFNFIAKENKNIKDGYSRLVFKDYDTLSNDIYKHKYPVIGLISYLDIYEGENKLFTTYLHYDLETFETIDFQQITLDSGAMPEYWQDKIYSTFPHEGTFLNYVRNDIETANIFSTKYLNTFKKTKFNNSCLSSFRFELLDNSLLIPEYCMEESAELWGDYLDVISSTKEKVTREHHSGTISYYKVSLEDLRSAYKG